MDNSSKNLFSLANAALRDKDYKAAISLYEEAMIGADEYFKSHIRFNYEFARRKIQLVPVTSLNVKQKKEPIIPVIKFDDTEECHTSYKKNDQINPRMKIIAFYLPQFHPIPENDEWWGRGFTEWSNVGKALPNFVGHYQPHCPIHFGYYDLRIPSVMEEQSALAKEYGIFGFSYYYYWFAGKTLLEGPLLSMLENDKVDMPFCLTWANENWTRRWDGQESDVLMGQEHSPEDSLAFIRNIIKYFKDPRYIRINNKPLLIIYRASIIPEIQSTVSLWREEVLKFGFDGVYLVAAQTFGIKSPEPFGFDASVEFPPHTVSSSEISNEVEIVNNEFSGKIYSYEQVVDNAVKYKDPEYKNFRTAMLSWDNTARKQNASHIFHRFSLLKYKQWLNCICSHVYSNNKYENDEKIVFINAWNEWAEGTHLEPDRRYGYAYLQSTYDILKLYDSKKLACLSSQKIIQRSSVAVILHVHYIDVLDSVKCYLKNFSSIPFDLYITTTNSDVIQSIKTEYPDSYVALVENRGRDVLPFIEMLKLIHHFEYDAVCKIHTKRSDYREDGSKLRSDLYDALLGSQSRILNAVKMFKDLPMLGLAVPSKFLIPHTSHNMYFDTEIVNSLARIMDVDFQYSVFPAGSMFWFRQKALSRLLLLDCTMFSAEAGLADGTSAHGVERLFSVAASADGYRTISLLD